MLNQNSVSEIEKSNLNSFFKKPLYESYCFSNIPQTVFNLLTNTHLQPALPDNIGIDGQKFKKIVLFYIDAFGWKAWEKYQDKIPLLKQFKKQAVISKLTSQFPSTTSAHFTTIETGQTVGESGIFEWFHYDPNADAVINPLLFSYAGDQSRETLAQQKIDPAKVYPKNNYYHSLKKNNIDSYVLQNLEYNTSSYASIITQKATKISHTIVSEGLINLTQHLQQNKNKAYYFFYYEQFDNLCHKYGPDSPYAEAEIMAFFTQLEKIVFSHKFKDTLFLLTADHGQMPISPKTTIYLNQIYPEITQYLRKNRQGKIIAPGGSSRDQFLYVKDEYVEKVKQDLTAKLKGAAEIYATDDLIKQEFFGKKISTRFLERVGSLVILPYVNQSVWWYEKGRFEQKLYGQHGGLSKEEIEIPLVSLTY